MIFDLINGILAQVNGLERYWFHRADLKAESPDTFIVYDLNDYPAHRGDGEETATNYTVTFNIFGKSPANVQTVYAYLLALLIEYGFTRAGCNYSTSDSFPEYYQKSVDFNYIYDYE